jgi:hypothetical protein
MTVNNGWAAPGGKRYASGGWVAANVSRGNRCGTATSAMQLLPSRTRSEHGAAYLAAASLVSAVAGGITPMLAGSLAEWFATRNLSILVRWVSPIGTRDVSVMTFAHREFLFALSALAGLFVLYALSRLQEGREISERRVVQELGLETLRTVSYLSSLGGVLALLLLFQAGSWVGRRGR